MRKALELWDTHMQRGTPASIAVGVALCIFFVVYAAVEPADRYLSLFFLAIGAPFLWQEYVVWRRKRAQGGLELIGTRRELEERGL